jgi:hypothetical protein
MSAADQWSSADPSKIAGERWYLVKTNGMEWRDHDLFLWRGSQVLHAMRFECVRGRPVLVAEVVNPQL